MVNYQKGKIYTIRSRNSDKVYVGSTCNELRKRIYEHKTDYKYWVDGNRKYISSYEVLKDGMCYIELFEKYPCNSKDELKRREGEVMRNMECVNKIKWIGMTREEMKEHIKEYNQRQEVKEKKNVRGKKYYQNNKECFKEYYQNNIDIIKEYRKEYYQKNKEEYNKKQKEKFTCECGRIVSRRHKAVHMRSKKHKTWEEIQNIS